MWNVIITLTTTGFGELYPKTLFGRLIGLVICFWGTLMVSFFVVTINNMLAFTPSEEKSFNLLQRLEFKEELKKYAVNVLSSSYRHSAIVKKAVKEKKKLGSSAMKAFKHFRNKILSFK
jgi:Ion channel